MGIDRENANDGDIFTDSSVGCIDNAKLTFTTRYKVERSSDIFSFNQSWFKF